MSHNMLLIVGPLLGFLGMMSGGYWGVGCGWIVVPVLLMMGFSPVEAVGIGLLQMFPSTFLTVCRQFPEIGWKTKTDPGWSLAFPIGIGACISSLTGKLLNRQLSAAFGSDALQWMLIGVIVLISVQTLTSRTRAYSDEMPPISRKTTHFAFLGGLVTGLFSSLLGIGGGLLIRPLLATVFRVPEYYTSRIVRFLLMVTTFVGGATYLIGNGGFDWKIFSTAMLIAVGGIAGFPLGAHLHKIVYDNGYAQHIHKSFAIVAVALFISTICNIFGMNHISRILMIVIAVALTLYLAIFTRYTVTHPRLRK